MQVFSQTFSQFVSLAANFGKARAVKKGKERIQYNASKGTASVPNIVHSPSIYGKFFRATSSNCSFDLPSLAPVASINSCHIKVLAV